MLRAKHLHSFFSYLFLRMSVCLSVCVCVLAGFTMSPSMHEFYLEFVSECERLRVSDQPRLSSTTFVCVLVIFSFQSLKSLKSRKSKFKCLLHYLMHVRIILLEKSRYKLIDKGLLVSFLF